MPMSLFERWQIDHFAIGRESQAIAAPIVRLFPKYLFSYQIERGERVSGADVEPFCLRIRRDPFDIPRFSFVIEARQRNPLQKSMSVIDVEDDHPVAAIFEIV